MTSLADGADDGKPRARRSINKYLSAVIVAHCTAGFPLDREHPLIAETWRGMSPGYPTQDGSRPVRWCRSVVRDLPRGLRFALTLGHDSTRMPSRTNATSCRLNQIRNEIRPGAEPSIRGL